MIRLKKSIDIHASVDKVFNYVSNPESMVECIPSMMDVRDIQKTDKEIKYHWAYKMLGIRFEGDSESTRIPNKHIETRSKGGIQSTWNWDFEPHGEDTRINLNIEYSVPSPVLGKLAERLVKKQNEKEADLAMDNIKTMIEA